MSDAANNPRHNQLPASLSKEQWERWRLQLRYADMPLGHVLYEPGDTLNHLFMGGGGSASSRALAQSADGAYRLSAELVKVEFDRAGPVLHLLLRHTQALMTQMVQTAAATCIIRSIDSSVGGHCSV